MNKWTLAVMAGVVTAAVGCAGDRTASRSANADPGTAMTSSTAGVADQSVRTPSASPETKGSNTTASTNAAAASSTSMAGASGNSGTAVQSSTSESARGTGATTSEPAGAGATGMGTDSGTGGTRAPRASRG